MTNCELLALEAAACALNVSARTLQRWMRDGAPTAVPGARGRGRAALFDCDAIRAWRRDRDRDAMRVFAGVLPSLIGDATFAAFVDLNLPQKTEAALLLAGVGYRITAAVLDHLRAAYCSDIPELSAVPPQLERLRRIFDVTRTVR